MKPDKAIEILTILSQPESILDIQDKNNALRLGIEALDKWKARHERSPDDVNFLLPGETED